MITAHFIQQNKILFLFGGIILTKRIIHQKLFVGIVIGFLLCYYINNKSFMNAFSSALRTNGNCKDKKHTLFYTNKDIKLKRAFIDIRKYEGTNYLAVNKSLKHMERFMKIRHNFNNVEDTTQFYSLAVMERKKSLQSLKTILLQSSRKMAIKIINIIRYIEKVSGQYLHDMIQINNDRWNKGDVTTHPIYTEELDGYESDMFI